MRELSIYEVPMSLSEVKKMYSTQECIGGCLICDSISKRCYSNCSDDEYGALCNKCDSKCASCFGGLSSQCFACRGKNNYNYDHTLCNFCGDVFILTSEGEECDDKNNIGGDGLKFEIEFWNPCHL